MKKQIYHSLVLDNTQVHYLMHGTAGINRMTCLFQLIEVLVAQIERTPDVGECPEVLWQVKMSEVGLSKLWKCDRKTVSKMLGKMKELHILSSVQTRRGSVHTFLCISGWGIDGRKFANPNYVPIDLRKKRAKENEAISSTDGYNKLPSSSSAETNAGDNAEIHSTMSNDSIRCVDKHGEATVFSSSLCSSPNTTKPLEPEIPDPDPESMQMEEEARQHFCESEMEHRDIGTDNTLTDLSQSPNAHTNSVNSDEDDAHR